MEISYFDPLTTNAVDLQHMLESGQITSVQIIEQYLQQIERHERSLNALVSIAPRESLRRIASSLHSRQRAARGSVAKLVTWHPYCAEGAMGPSFPRIEILFLPKVPTQDCFITASDLGMTTCAGAVAFTEAKASKNGAIVQRLIDAGIIILAKANMTEFAGMKTLEMMPGWSPHGGQTISPYVGPVKENEKLLGHSAPGGSSTESAVSVAAGFSPLALGAETIGSIVTPSVRAALYALKPTIGIQDTIDWDFKNIGIPEFIKGFDECPVQSLEDIIKFNEEHSSAAMPEPYTKQGELIKALGYDQSPEDMIELKRKVRNRAREVLDEVFDEKGVNLIGAPGDSALRTFAAAAGYPHATVPLGKLRYNGRPFGVYVMGRANE
ncbi:hypothetical protein M426DRAFT_11887 [Hypoxylon sp. CI-4A]|nr:hypothetical protein M426DRAFT_11887 [Hypoxylon sp. CI-4A]